MEETLTFSVNGQQYTVTTDPERPLLDVLREDLHLTGTKYGCAERQCGACTVLVNGRTVMSCSTRVATADGKDILTIEGLAKDGKLHPVQEAFLAEGVMQCGYCTSGMIMAAVALLNQTPHPTEAQIRRKMQRNVCRCGTYLRIIRAIQRAAASPGGGAA